MTRESPQSQHGGGQCGWLLGRDRSVTQRRHEEQGVGGGIPSGKAAAKEGRDWEKLVPLCSEAAEHGPPRGHPVWAEE